jgi:hypothetical protein
MARATWEEAMLADAGKTWQAQWECLAPGQELLAKVEELIAAKYGREDYHRMR